MEIGKEITYNQPKHFPFEITYVNGYIENEIVPKIYTFKSIFFTGRGHILRKKYGLINLAEDRYSFYNWGIKKKLLFIFKSIRNSSVFFNNCILILDDWTNNPYHFIVDFVCKLEFLEKQVLSFNNYTLILNDSFFSADFGLLVLEYLNFRFRSIKFIRKQSINFSFGKLITSSRVSFNGTSNRSLIQGLQRRKNYINISATDKKFKIYYYRQNTKRKILNNDEVLNIFKQRGYFCVDFAEHSLVNILPILQQSSCLIGLHGAGLANMIFLPHGSLVVEFKTKNSSPKNHCYWHMAQNLNLGYEVFIVESEFNDNDILEGSTGVNVKVNIPLLEKYLDKLDLDE